MRCSGSPTICTADSPDSADRRRAADAVTRAVLFREILKPLAAGLGPVGETALGLVADRLFAERRA